MSIIKIWDLHVTKSWPQRLQDDSAFPSIFDEERSVFGPNAPAAGKWQVCDEERVSFSIPASHSAAHQVGVPNGNRELARINGKRHSAEEKGRKATLPERDARSLLCRRKGVVKVHEPKVRTEKICAASKL